MPDSPAIPRPRRPVCPSLVICERAAVDRERGRVDMIGAFDALTTPALPMPLAVFVAFAVTEAQGSYEFGLSLEHDQTEQTLGSTSKRVEIPSPMLYFHDAVPMRFEVRQPGAFTVKLKANGQMIAQRTFTIAVDVPAAAP